MLICCEFDLLYHSYIPLRNISKVLLVHDKWYSYLWWNLKTIFIFGCCFELSAFIAKLVLSNSFCLPCIFWILLLYSKFALCSLVCGKAMIPFMCIYFQKSYFLIMHYSWGSHPTLSRSPFFKLVLHLLAFLEHD